MRFAAALGCAVIVLAPLALAQPGEVVRLQYEAPSGCPDAEAFVAEVHARSPRIRFGDEGTRSLVVRLAPSHGRILGNLALRDADGAVRQRTVTGAQCSEVVSGLALVAAVAIDPSSATGAPSATLPVDAAPPSVEPDAGAAGDSEAVDATPPAPDPQAHWELSIAADAELAFGAAPIVLFTVPISLEVALATKRLFAPALRVRFVRSTGATRDANGEGADFTFTVGDLDLCPIAWSPWRLRLQGCARGELGALEGEGLGIFPAQKSVRPFFALGPVFDLRLTVLGPLFLYVQGALVFSVFRDRYFLEPDTTVFDVPVVGGRMGSGLGAALW